MKPKIRTTLLASLAAVAAVSAGIIGGAATASDPAEADSDTTMMSPPPLLKSELPSKRFKIPTGVTPDGRTYGSGVDVHRSGKLLDLISVIGDSGLKGYVDREALEGLADDVLPEDADAYQERIKRGEIKLPVYAEDGKTRIDWFTQGDRDLRFEG